MSGQFVHARRLNSASMARRNEMWPREASEGQACTSSCVCVVADERCEQQPGRSEDGRGWTLPRPSSRAVDDVANDLDAAPALLDVVRCEDASPSTSIDCWGRKPCAEDREVWWQRLCCFGRFWPLPD